MRCAIVRGHIVEGIRIIRAARFAEATCAARFNCGAKCSAHEPIKDEALWRGGEACHADAAPVSGQQRLPDPVADATTCPALNPGSWRLQPHRPMAGYTKTTSL